MISKGDHRLSSKHSIFHTSYYGNKSSSIDNTIDSNEKNVKDSSLSTNVTPFESKEDYESTASLYQVDQEHKDNFRAAILELTANFIFALIFVVHKLLYTYEVGPFFQVVFKSSGLLVTYILTVITQKVDLTESNQFIKENYKPFIIRIFFGVLSGVAEIVCLMYVNVTSLAVASCFVPIISTIISSYILQGQTYNRQDIVILIICLVSSFFIIDNQSSSESNPHNTRNLIIGYLLCFIYLAGNAIRIVYSKILYKINVSYQLVYVLAVQLLSGLLLAPLFNEDLWDNSISLCLLMFGIGICESLPLYMNIYSLNIGDISLVMQIDYSFLPFMTILSFLIVGEVIGLSKGIGILVIFSVSIYRTYLNFKESTEH